MPMFAAATVSHVVLHANKGSSASEEAVAEAKTCNPPSCRLDTQYYTCGPLVVFLLAHAQRA